MRVALPEPVQLGSLRLREREYVAVRLETDAGTSGCAWSLTRNLPVLEALERLVTPHALGQDVARTAAIWDATRGATRATANASVAMRALSLVDIALWDLKAAGAGLPLHTLLGGLHQQVPVIAVCGYPRHGSSPSDAGLRAAELLAGGHGLVKVPRWPTVETTAELLRSACSAGADAGRIVVDAAWAWDDAHAALREIEAWGVGRLAWLEDPLPATRVTAYQRLRPACPHPLGIGDEVHDPDVLAQLVISGVMDVMRLDATVAGGVTGAWRAMDFAWQLGLPVSLHIHLPIHVHLAAAHPACIAAECFDAPDAHFDPEHRLITSSPPLDSGEVAAPERPGLGCELDLEFVTRHAHDHYLTSAPRGAGS